MKTIIAFVLCLVAGDILGQYKATPIYLLNDDTVDIENVYIKPSSIDAVNVEKKTKRGEIHIVTKRTLTFISLDAILKKYSDVGESVGSVVYSVNDKVVTDKAQVKVDNSFFIQVDIKPLGQVTYINEEYRHLIWVDIQLLNEKPKPKIMIRGYETAQVRE